MLVVLKIQEGRDENICIWKLVEILKIEKFDQNYCILRV